MRILILSTLLLITQLSFAQSNTTSGSTANGLKYEITKDVPGPTAKAGDISKIHVNVRVGDSVVFDSKIMNNNLPVIQPISEGRNLADLMEGFMLLSQGDLAIFTAPASALITNEQQRPPFIKEDDKMVWEVEMVELKTQKEIDAANLIRFKEEKELLVQYGKDNNLELIETPDGDYIVLVEAGKGAAIKKGEIVSMNYTGYLLDGAMFDSNVDPKFNHVNEFDFPLGQGLVIKGWDNSLAGHTIGSKLKLLIPSMNAYGDRDTPPSDANPKGIPPHSPLIFDVEILGSRDAPNAESSDIEK